MSFQYNDEALTSTQQDRIDELRSDEVKHIDAALVANASYEWRKASRVIGAAMLEMDATLPGIPDIFYLQRIRDMVELGRLDMQGSTAAMQYFEIRLPAT